MARRSAPTILRKGDRGERVRNLQRMLSAAGYQVNEDGEYGRQTEAAVRQFQSSRGLVADGKAGKSTADALQATPKRSPARQAETPPRAAPAASAPIPRPKPMSAAPIPRPKPMADGLLDRAPRTTAAINPTIDYSTAPAPGTALPGHRMTVGELHERFPSPSPDSMAEYQAGKAARTAIGRRIQGGNSPLAQVDSYDPGSLHTAGIPTPRPNPRRSPLASLSPLDRMGELFRFADDGGPPRINAPNLTETNNTPNLEVGPGGVSRYDEGAGQYVPTAAFPIPRPRPANTGPDGTVNLQTIDHTANVPPIPRRRPQTQGSFGRMAPGQFGPERQMPPMFGPEQPAGLLSAPPAATAAPMGLLPETGASGGLLGNFGKGKFGDFLRDNSMGLMMAGAGMMSGGIGSGDGFRGFAQGGQLDTQRRERAEERAAAEERKNALNAVLTASDLSPEERAYLLSDPSAASKFMADRMGGSGAAEVKRYNVGGALVDADGNVIYQAPQEQEAPPTTDDITEFNFARQQGYTGNFQEFLAEKRGATNEPPTDVQLYQFDMQQRQAAGQPPVPFAQWDAERAAGRRAQTNVNVGGGRFGTIPAGYQLIEDPETGAARLEIVPGGPADQEARAAEEAAAAGRQQQQTQGNVVVQDIDRALAIIDANPTLTTGIGGNLAGRIPGTPAYNLDRLLDTVKANAGFDQLQQMRDSSPTGGALGQITERELAFLQAVIGSLEQSQGPDQLRFNLKRVRDAFRMIVDGSVSPSPPSVQGGQPAPVQQTAPTQTFDWTPDGGLVPVQ